MIINVDSFVLGFASASVLYGIFVTVGEYFKEGRKA